MHRFSSQSAIMRVKLASLLLCLKYLLTPLAGGILIYSIAKGNEQLTWIAIGLGIVTMVLVLTQWVLAAKTRCPLCLTPVLATKGCSKHRNAKTLFGSHRLRVALSALFKGRFYCPYCHEPSVLQVRQRRE
jgi:hypothetical protein